MNCSPSSPRCYFYPLQLHAVFDNNCDDVEYAVLKFDLHTINIPHSYLSKMYDIFIRRTSEKDFCIITKKEVTNQKQISFLIDRILTEYETKDEFYFMQLQSDLHTLLIEIARKSNTRFDYEGSNHTDDDFSFYRILEYIDLHSGEQLEVENLADMCNMSYSHFAKLFRENYGRSCKEYITYIRLNKAQDLLLHTNYSLTYIAMETGFFDCSHFIKTYKKWKGITPNQQRKNYSLPTGNCSP